MTRLVLIMYAVAAATGLPGLWMLFQLRRRGLPERKVYAYRIVGTMAASLGLVLAIYATAQWSWGTAP